MCSWRILPVLSKFRVESVQNEQRKFRDCSFCAGFRDGVFDDIPERLGALKPPGDSHRTIPFRKDEQRDFVPKCGPKSNASSDETFRKVMKGNITWARYVNFDQMQL